MALLMGTANVFSRWGTKLTASPAYAAETPYGGSRGNLPFLLTGCWHLINIPAPGGFRPMSDQSLQPRENRSSVIIRAVVRTASGNEVERRIRNLSVAGACVEHIGDLAPGDNISLEMGSLKHLRAEVI